MAFKSLVDIELNDGEWQKFLTTFQQFKKDASSVSMTIGQVDRASPRLSAAIDRQARDWKSMARDSATFAANVASATLNLLRWASVTGIISGMVGFGGGLFGLDRLAMTAGTSRFSAQGVGTTPSQSQAFRNNLGGRLVGNPDQVLGGVANLLTNPTDPNIRALYNLGLDYGAEQQKGTFQASLDAIRAAAEQARRSNVDQLGIDFDTRGYAGLGITREDYRRFHDMKPEEVEQYLGETQRDEQRFRVPDQALKGWQDFVAQMQRSWQEITNALEGALAPLRQPLQDLSKSFGDAAVELLKSKGMADAIAGATEGLQTFAAYVKTPAFEQNVKTFAEEIGTLAKGTIEFAKDVKSLADATVSAVSRVTGFLDDLDKNAPKTTRPTLRDYLEDPKPDPSGKTRFQLWQEGVVGMWDALMGNDKLAPPPAQPSTPQPGPLYRFMHPSAFVTGDDGGGIDFPGDVTFNLTGNVSFSGGGMGASGGPGMAGMVQQAAFRVPMPSGSAMANLATASSFLKSRGWDNETIAGILGNLQAESGLNPQAFNPAGGGQGAQGIAQWRGTRVDNFRMMFGHDPREGTLDEQLTFLDWELRNTEADAGAKLRAAVGVRAKSDAFQENYERGGTNFGYRENLSDQLLRQIFGRAQPEVNINNNTGGNNVVTTNLMVNA